MSSQQQRSRHRALGGQGIPQQGESDVGAFGGPYTTYDDDEGRSRSPTHPLRLPAQFPPWQAVVEQPRDINTHGRRPAPPVPSSLVGGYRTTPSRPRKDETSTQPSATYQSGELESPRYHWAEQEDTKSLGPASMHSDRSIYIGFDPSEEPRDSLNSSLGIIPHFPAVVSAQQQRRPPPAGNNQPPPSRRVTPAYFSQTPSMQVTPIPEESTSPRRASYASSTAIPTAWDPNHFESSSDDQQSRKTQLQQRIDEYVEPGLVRQASFGRKTKPTLTTINRSKSNNSLSNAGPSTTPGLPPAAMSPGASGSLPRIITGAGQSPLLASKPAVSSPISQPAMAAVSSKSHERDGLDNEVRGSRSLFYKDTGGFRSPSNRESGSRRAFDKETSTPFDVTTPRKGAGRTRLKPPRLNLDSVRDAEARGSLTSLPDLIRRATKLAAVLERGRPSSQAWGARGSMFDRSKPPTSRVLLERFISHC